MGKVLGNHADDGGKSPRKQGTVGTGYDAAFRGYINLALTPDQKAAFEVWNSDNNFWAALERHTGDGINFSLKYTPKDACFLASATQRREASPNAGLVVTARARDAGMALARCVYCVCVVAQTDRWEETQPLADPDRW